jgi:hypothetical protein
VFARGGGEGGCVPFCCVELVGLERGKVQGMEAYCCGGGRRDIIVSISDCI